MYLVLAKPVEQVVLLLHELLDLGGEGNVGEIEPAVFMVVAVFVT